MIVQLTVWMAIATGVASHVSHVGDMGVIGAIVHGLRDTAASVPLIALAVVAGLELAAFLRNTFRIGRGTVEMLLVAQGIALATVAMLVPGAILHGILLERMDVALAHALADAAAIAPVALVAAFGLVLQIRLPLDLAAGAWSRVAAEGVLAVLANVAEAAAEIKRSHGVRLGRAGVATIVIGASITAVGSPAAAVVPSDAEPCTSSVVDRSYDITAVNVVIPRNRWGDVDPHGQVFVLDRDKQAVRYWAFPLSDVDDPADGRRLRPRPLVLRANEGECLEVTLTNELDDAAPVPGPFCSEGVDSEGNCSPDAWRTEVGGEGLPVDQYVSLHMTGVAYDANTSDGGAVGFNDDTTIAPGQSRTYHVRVPADEGIHLFRDTATLAGSEADGGSTSHGLYGALVVEPAGSIWLDPVSGVRLDTQGSGGGYVDAAAQSGELYIEAVIVPPGAQSGQYAIDSLNLQRRATADGVAFREVIQLSQDEMPGEHLQNCDLTATTYVDGRPDRSSCQTARTETEGSLTFGIGLGFNYGEENLLLRSEEINRCPDCVSEETWLSSWAYGDPALVKLASGFGPWYPTWHPWYDGGAGGGGNHGQQNFANTDDPEDCGLDHGCYTSNVPHSYQYDPTKVRFLHAGPKETHVFHMHAHQWLTDPQDIGASGNTPGVPDQDNMPEATTIDSQTFGPGEGYTADLLFGAGSKPGTVGDSIMHCHLYPHFAEGFWSLFRVHDVYEDGTGVTPDGTKVREVRALPDRSDIPNAPTAFSPGYPRFMPGEFGWRAPQAIDGISEPNGLPDNPLTVEREDLSPATRLVAGVGLEQPVQQVVITPAVGGPAPTFTLGLDGETTGSLAHGATAAQVRDALKALGAVGDVEVSGAGTAANPYLVRFILLDNADPAPTIRLVVVVTAGGTGTVSAAWVDGGAGEAAATKLAYQLSLERARVLLSHNDGVYDSGDGSWDPLSGTLPARSNVAGSPLVDPCPSGSRQVIYNISMIQLDIVYNEAGWHDSQGRILVLTEDVDEILAGTKPVEPFFFRANPGDCVTVNMTNQLSNWMGDDDFLKLIQTNMTGQHIHLVKFDVTGSDGASNGWNYQEAAFSESQRLYNDAILAGGVIPATDELAHVAGDAATCGPDVFAGSELTADGCRLPLPTSWSPLWNCQVAGGCPVGQTITERWYVDYELKTIFTHDHHFPAVDQNRGLFSAMVVEPAGMDIRNPRTGAYMQPINDPAHGTPCGEACTANAVGTQVDIVGPGPSDDFREFALAIQDFVSLYRPCTSGCGSSQIPGQEPLAPPGEPELYPDDDPGVMGINYKNAPLVLRNSLNGVPTDPAYVFSSTVHGDPATPLLRAYAGDAVRVRLIQGAQEEQHVMQIHGVSWRDEPDDPESPFVASRSLGISEAFNFQLGQVPDIDCKINDRCFADYLYGGTSTDDMWNGAWGLMRVFGRRVSDLLNLPDNERLREGDTTPISARSPKPIPSTETGFSCPDDIPERDYREYNVIAVDTRISYNETEYDPYGLVYAVQREGETPQAAAARVRATNPEPMVLRAVEGECIEVVLTNMIDPAGAFATQHAPVGATQSGNGFDPPLVLEPSTGTPAGLRVSLHADLLSYDVRGSDGATVGYNRDQTVGPRPLASAPGTKGESIKYRWYAPETSPGELGAVNLTDYGDVRGHRHHGLFAGLVVEPKGAIWTDPISGEVGTTSPQADIRVPGEKDFREFVTFYQDGVNLWYDGPGGRTPVPDSFDHPPTPEEPEGELPDSEDRGEKGLNYRSEPFQQRLGLPPGSPLDNLPGADLAAVFSSIVHGDPSTPVFRAYAGDDIRWRVLQGADKPRQHTFSVGGHSWLRQPNDAASETELIGAQGGFSVGRALNVHTMAGGTISSRGDFRYGDEVLDHKLSDGWWGILRVYDAPPDARRTYDPLRAMDSPYQDGYAPIRQLGLTSITVKAVADKDGDAVVDRLEGALKDPAATPLVTIKRQGAPPGDPPLYMLPLPTTGTLTLPVEPDHYEVSLAVGPDYTVTGLSLVTVDATDRLAPPTETFTVTQLGDIRVRVLNDPDGGNVSNHKGGVAGWTVEARMGALVFSGVTNATGSVTIDGLLPGKWTVVAIPLPGWKVNALSPPTVTLLENSSKEVKIGVSKLP